MSQVWIKDLTVDMEIKNRGIELGVYDTSENHIGDLVITKSKLIWCEGRTQRKNGKKISWEAFREIMNKL